MSIGTPELEGELTTTIEIDTKLITKAVGDELAAVSLDAIREYFLQPGVQEKFEIWQAARRLKLASSGSGGRA